MTELYKDILTKELEAISTQYNAIAVMCSGPQNYGLDTQADYFDTVAIVVPSFEDLVNEGHINRTVRFGCGSCDIKDVRLFVKDLKDQDLGAVETLFSEYIIAEPRFSEVLDLLLGRKENIAIYNKERSLGSMYALLSQEEEAIRAPEEANAPETVRKHYMEVFKYALMADKYIKGFSFGDVLDCSKISYLREKAMPVTEMQIHAEHLREKTRASIDHWTSSEVHIADKSTEQWLDTWLIDLLRAEILGPGISAAKDDIAEESPHQTDEEGSKEDTGSRIRSLFKRKSRGE